jgi:hypothetical protein
VVKNFSTSSLKISGMAPMEADGENIVRYTSRDQGCPFCAEDCIGQNIVLWGTKIQ